MVFEGADAPSSFPRVQLMRGSALLGLSLIFTFFRGEFKRDASPSSQNLPPPLVKWGRLKG